MGNSPQMPANMPITRSRVVRGEAVRRIPGSASGIGLPRFSWPGVVDSLDHSPAWGMDANLNLLEALVIMETATAGLEFDIYVNEAVVDSVAASALYIQRYDIVVPVALNDAVALELTDFGAGTAEDISVVLRPFITPAFEA